MTTPTSRLTITEALAEIKTIGKRLVKKQAFICENIARQDGIKDPLLRDGGSEAKIASERQSYSDLCLRIIKLRNGIDAANSRELVTVKTVANVHELTIADWITWRREVAPLQRQLLEKMQGILKQAREQAKRQGLGIGTSGTALQPTDIVVNIDEGALAASIEEHEEVLGLLDGLLSLKNATTFVDVD